MKHLKYLAFLFSHDRIFKKRIFWNHDLQLQVMNEDGHTSSIRDKILTITVKKGWKPGTRITFPQEGDQGPNNIPGIKY